MKIKSFGIVLTVVNLLILSIILTQHKSAFAQQPPLKKVSTQALEIVDSKGQVRASISIMPPVEMNGKKYPETVLLRLTSSKGKPLVKMVAAEDGSGLMLINNKDEGLQMNSNDEGSYIRMTENGKQREIKP